MHRISFDVNDEVYNAFAKLIPHGMKRSVFRMLCKALIEFLENSNDKTLSLLHVIRGDIRIEEKREP